MTLFPTEPISGTEFRKLSAGQRLTIRRNNTLARGFHPVTRRPLLHVEWDRTCGDCDHHVVSGGHARSFHKCDLNRSGGPATDIRVGWRACTAFRESA